MFEQGLKKPHTQTGINKTHAGRLRFSPDYEINTSFRIKWSPTGSCVRWIQRTHECPAWGDLINPPQNILFIQIFIDTHERSNLQLTSRIFSFFIVTVSNQIFTAIVFKWITFAAGKLFHFWKIAKPLGQVCGLFAHSYVHSFILLVRGQSSVISPPLWFISIQMP